MISSAPSLSEAYGILLQEEHQREKSTVTSTFSENAAMAIKQYNESMIMKIKLLSL